MSTITKLDKNVRLDRMLRRDSKRTGATKDAILAKLAA
jgi:hypothetical protein